MLQVDNRTAFAAGLAVLPDPEGVDTLYTTVKGTFRMGEPAAVAAEQVPLLFADEHWGEPDASSIRRPADVHLPKPATDVLLVGHARAPGGAQVTELDVSVRVGDLRKRVRVVGDRAWKAGLLAGGMTAPRPFEAIPLVWERAFGGVHVVDAEKGRVLWEPRNPVGRGFTGKRKLRELDGEPLPNLEHPDHPVRRPGAKGEPACFAAVAASWAPRAGRAGTYDDAWRKRRAPFLPADFDPRFLNVAPEGLTAAGYLRGDEPVELEGVSTDGPLRFRLPGVRPRTRVELGGETHAPRAFLETVLLEPDEGRLCLVWRSAVRCDGRALKVRRVTVDLEDAHAELVEGAA